MKNETNKANDKEQEKSRLKQLRERKGVTQIAMQIATGIDQSELSKMERGDRAPTLEQAIILSRFFETSIDYICEETDEIERYPRKIKE
ncbi:MAG: helix-turn-helix transcriptional regulator [Firmicutes bacterium]|nr:helix-turn-helix transcriptional regulator [Bacillota bacterium]